MLMSKRGRPRKERPTLDYGTPELIAKRAANLTVEPLDLCLERGIISKNEHWAGIHFRWLYTLCFGAPGVSALDINDIGGRSITAPDEAWQQEREKEYGDAIAYLRKIGSKSLVMNLCIFNQPASFLAASGRENHFTRYQEYTRFKEALAGLLRVFRY